MDDLLEEFLGAHDALADLGGAVELNRLLAATSAQRREQWRDAVLGAASHPPRPRDEPERLAFILGVDDALAHCAPERRLPGEPVPEPLAPLRNDHLENVWLWRSSAGDLLLPRRCRYGRPRDDESTADLCMHVIRVPPAVAARVNLAWAPIGCDHPAGTGPDIEVAASPLMGPGDLEIAGVEDSGKSWYRLAPRTDRLRPVVERLLQSLVDVPAAVYLLPEAALDPDLLEHWCRGLAADPAGTASMPRWLMLGSGPFPSGDGDPPANRAVLLHSATGMPLIEHDKRLPFKLEGDQVERWNLAEPAPAHDHAGLGPGERGEFIRTGTGPVTVLESHAGRFGVLVCEDMARTAESPTPDLIAVGVSHLLVPVFAKEVTQYRWEDRYAGEYVLAAGTRVAVVNSLVVALLDDERDSDEVRFLLLSPTEGQPSSGRLLTARTPTDVVTGTLTGP